MTLDKYEQIIKCTSTLQKAPKSIKTLAQNLDTPFQFFNVFTQPLAHKNIKKYIESNSLHVNIEDLNKYITENGHKVLDFIIDNYQTFAAGKSKEPVYNWVTRAINSESVGVDTYKTLTRIVNDSINNGDIYTLNWILSIRNNDYSKPNNHKIHEIIQKEVIEKELPESFLKKLEYYTGNREFLSHTYNTFFTHYEKNSHNKIAINNLNSILEAATKDHSQNAEGQFSIELLKYYDNEKYEFVCRLPCISKNREEGLMFGSILVSQAWDYNMSHKEEITDPIYYALECFGTDNLSDYDVKMLVDSLYYKDYVSKDKMLETIEQYFQPENEADVISNISGAILYRHRTNGEKFNAIIEKWLPNIDRSDVRKILTETIDPTVFTTNFEKQAKELLRINQMLELKTELNEQLSSSDKPTKRMKV